MLDGDYALLRSRIRRSKPRARLRELLRTARSAEGLRPDLPALLLWLLEGEGRKDRPYPFSLPHRDFQLRCGQFPAACRDRAPARNCAGCAN